MKKRIPDGLLKLLSNKTNLSQTYLSGVIGRTQNISTKRAKYLEAVCKKIGINISASMWAFASTEELKDILYKFSNPAGALPDEKK